MRESKSIFRLRHACFTIACLCLFLTAASAIAAPWSFVVAGDDRTDPYSLAVRPDPTGVNTGVFTNFLHAIATDETHPDFMLFTGDLVAGTTERLRFVPVVKQFTAWQELVTNGLPNLLVLPVRGNHETLGDPTGAHWKAVFKSGLDATRVTWFPGEEGFSYYYSPPAHPAVAVIAVDQFLLTHRVNLEGLTNALERAKTNGVSHIFVFAHEMAFTCSGHPDKDNMAAFPDDRDRFIEALQKYGCQYFFAGHDHAYDWMAIRHAHWPTNYVLNQIVAGTAGAPFYGDKGYYGDHHGYDLTRVDHKEKTYGYLRVTMDDSSADGNVTVKFVTVNIP